MQNYRDTVNTTKDEIDLIEYDEWSKLICDNNVKENNGEYRE